MTKQEPIHPGEGTQLTQLQNENNTVHTHVHEDGTVHTHVHEDGTVHTHSHGMTDETGQAIPHGHAHTHTQTKNVLNRLSRAIGHLESVKRMVEDGRDCSEVLVQLAAVRAALSNTGKVIIKDHIEHCVVDAVEYNDTDSIEELIAAIDKFM